MLTKYIWCALAVVSLISGCASTNSQRTNNKVGANYEKAYEEYYQLGASYLNMGRYDLAETKLKHAIEIDAQPPLAWNALALLYEQKRDISSGFQTYQKLINSHPDYVLGFFNFATFLCKFKRDQELATLYTQMRSKNNDFKTISYVAEGNCAESRQNDQNAINAYRKALEIEPHSFGALLPLARISIKNNDFNSAKNYLKVIHTYVDYSPESVKLTIEAARGSGDSNLENEMIRVMRASYSQTPEAQELGL